MALIVNAVHHRHGLVPGVGKSSVREVAAGVVGLHAARTISAFPIAAARLNDPVGVDAIREFPHEDGLMRIRCMRKTLHVLPVSLAPIAHCATVRYRRRDCLTQLRRHLDETAILRQSQKVLECLSGDWVSQSEIEEIFRRATDTPLAVWRLVLKLLWESGEVICHNGAPFWNQERRVFRSAESHFGSDILNTLPEELAERELVAAYIRSYGPATTKDIAWWSGLSFGRVTRAIDALAEVTAMHAKWCESVLYLIEEDCEALTVAQEVQQPWIRLVGHEDVAFKAYFETRHRYVDSDHYDDLFNTIGEARPAIVVNGKAVGVWSWSNGHVNTQWFERRQGARFDHMLADEVSRLEQLLQARDVIRSAQQRLW